MWVTPTAGAQQKVQDTLAPQLQSAGWQVELNPRTDEVDWSFHKDGFDLITFLNPAQGTAVVGGSSPCLPQKA